MRKGKYQKIGRQSIDGKTYDVYSNTVDVEKAVREDSGLAFFLAKKKHLEAVVLVPSNRTGIGRVYFRPKGSAQNYNMEKATFKYRRRRFRKPEITWISDEGSNPPP